MADSKSGKTITIEQTGSRARGTEAQIGTLIGLGLNKLRSRSTLQDTPEVRGMIRKIPHLVRIVTD